jgi:hypothetical protein
VATMVASGATAATALGPTNSSAFPLFRCRIREAVFPFFTNRSQTSEMH